LTRSWAIIAGVAAIAAAGAAYWYASVKTRTASPWDILTSSQLDPSTPMTQHGLKLLQIARVTRDTDPRDAIEVNTTNAPDGDSVGLFIQTPDGDRLSAQAGRGCGFQDTVCAGQIRVDARTSEGDEIALPWHALTPVSKGILYSRIPGGYPGNIHWIEVTVTDAAENHATWRITNLPHTRRIEIPDGPRQAQHEGLIVEGKAGVTRIPVPATDWPATMLLVNLTARSASRSRRIITCEPSPAQAEWEPADIGPYVSGSPSQTPEAVTQHDFVQTVDTGWPAANRRVRVSGKMTAYDSYDERAMFHDVRVTIEQPDPGNGAGPVGHITVEREQMIRTPSGVTITLPAQDETNPDGDGISMDVVYGQRAPLILSDSPLYSRRHQPIDRIETAFEEPVTVIRAQPSRTSGSTTLFLRWPGATPGNLADFPVIVRQETQTAFALYDFTLPVERSMDAPEFSLVPHPNSMRPFRTER
jgi:hypothetical protein